MRETEEVELKSELAQFPTWLRILRNPVAIILATYVSYYAIGQVIVGDSLVALFLESAGSPEIDCGVSAARAAIFPAFTMFGSSLVGFFSLKRL